MSNPSTRVRCNVTENSHQMNEVRVIRILIDIKFAAAMFLGEYSDECVNYRWVGENLRKRHEPEVNTQA